MFRIIFSQGVWIGSLVQDHPHITDEVKPLRDLLIISQSI